jgi:argininosuccinate lyase
LAGPRGVAGVGLRAIGSFKIQIEQVCAVYLMQEYRSYLQPLLPLRPVVGHGAGNVADMLAQTTALDYRTAHHVIGRVVRDQVEHGGEIDAARIAAAANEVAGAEIVVDEAELAAALDPAACAALRPQTGSSDADQVRAMCDDVAARSAEVRRWAEEVIADDAKAALALRAKARELAG